MEKGAWVAPFLSTGRIPPKIVAIGRIGNAEGAYYF